MDKNPRELSDQDSASPLIAAPSRRSVLAAGGFGLGALFLAACSGGTPSSAPSNSTAGGPPKKGGTLRVSMSDADTNDSLDPGVVLTASAVSCVNAIYDHLIWVDEKFQGRPGLATAWKSNADATEWTISLRKGVKWHDGSDFTSKDVAYTIRRWLDPSSGSSVNLLIGPYMDASGVSTPDPWTVVLKLKQANSVLIESVCTHYGSGIIKDGTTDFSAGNVVGTGPYKLKTWVPGQRWAVVRNDDYWDGAPYLDGVEVTVTPDQGAKLQAVLAGSTDATDTIPVTLWAGLQGKDKIALEIIPNERFWVFTFDQGQAPFNDPRVLEALKLATDRNMLVTTALQGHGITIADVPATPNTPYYPSGLTPEYDVAKAKQLLAEAGFPDGLDIELSTSGGVAGMSDIAQAWQQAVKAAGINVTLKEFPLSTYWSKAWLATPAFQDYWHNPFPPVAFDAFYRKGALWNGTHEEDPVLDKIVTQIYATTDAAKRTELVQQALLEARKTFSYLLPVSADAGYARASNVQGLRWSVLTSMDFRKTWLA